MPSTTRKTAKSARFFWRPISRPPYHSAAVAVDESFDLRPALALEIFGKPPEKFRPAPLDLGAHRGDVGLDLRSGDPGPLRAACAIALSAQIRLLARVLGGQNGKNGVRRARRSRARFYRPEIPGASL